MWRSCLLAILAACKVRAAYHCTSDEQCSGGTCAAGYCALADRTCASGERYDDSAGPLANTCLPVTSDAGTDVPAVWPCGPLPTVPQTTVTFDQIVNTKHLTISLTGTTLSGGPILVAAPGDSLPLATSYSILDCACPTCIDQIEIGWVPGTRDSCIFDETSPFLLCPQPKTGTVTRTITAPATPGQYDLRFKLGQDVSCGAHTGWWQNTVPDPASTVAVLCVQ